LVAQQLTPSHVLRRLSLRIWSFAVSIVAAAQFA